MKINKKLLNQIVSIVFPKRCPFCGQVILPEEKGCPDCIQHLPVHHVEKSCPRCGKTKCICGAEPALSHTFVCFYYTGPAERAVRSLKFHHHPGYARTLALHMAEKIEGDWDMLVPVPMTARKKRKRGYNQAELLARFLSEEIHTPEMPGALQKIRETKAQHTLSEKERLENLLGAYQSDLSLVKGKNVLIVDDVLTTGSTLREAAHTLLAAGAETVGAVVLCSVEYN